MGFLANWVIVPILRPVLLGMFDMEKFIKENCSDLNYTVVRPPGLGSAPRTGERGIFFVFFNKAFNLYLFILSQFKYISVFKNLLEVKNSLSSLK